MKRILALILSLFLLSVIGCATTNQEAPKAEEPAKQAEEVLETGPVDYDLSGTWMFIEKIIAPDCGGNKTNKFAVEIVQKDNSITAVKTEDENWTWTGKASGNTISIPKKRSGKVTISAYKLVVAEDANTVTGKINWDYDNGVCDGISNVTYERK